MRAIRRAVATVTVAMLAACHSADPIDLYAVATPRTATTDCVADRSRSTAIPFTRFDLGSAAIADGQHGAIVATAIGERATDAPTWTALWRKLADTLPPPRLDFTNRVLLVAATDLRARPTTFLDIGAVRQCTATGNVAVLVQLTASKLPTDEVGPRRAVAAAWAPALLLASAPIEFVRAPNAYAGVTTPAERSAEFAAGGAGALASRR